MIYSKSKEEHIEHLKLILELLKKEELYAKFLKCEFWLPKVQFLGHVIDSEGIHVDSAKIQLIKDWASPKTSTKILHFLEAAFQLLKQKLCSASILALPEGSENFVVYCDASRKGLGTVLMQREKRIQAARDRQKSYADMRHKPLEFEVGDKVMLKVSPWKRVIQQLSRVHSTFHVSNLKKCFIDEPLAIPLDEIHIDDKLHFIEEPVEIMDREVKRLKQTCIPIVKVRWNSRRGPEFT
ncbi:putative reverse transcriptase domain-containing protein [Tanacetum coccineum]